MGVTGGITDMEASFDAAASRYHSGVYNRKRQDLGVALHSSLLPVYLGQLKNAHKGAMAKFVADINASLKAPSYDFAQVVSRCTADARDAFLDAARGECPGDSADE